MPEPRSAGYDEARVRGAGASLQVCLRRASFALADTLQSLFGLYVTYVRGLDAVEIDRRDEKREH